MLVFEAEPRLPERRPATDRSEERSTRGPDASMTRFKKDSRAQQDFATTRKLGDMRSEDFDTIFYVGGHGPMWDLVDNPTSIALIESFYNSGKPVAAVCHSPAVFHRASYQGAPLLKGKRVTGFTNEEEEDVGLTHVVPFLVEEELQNVGAIFEKVYKWKPHAIVDGRLVTGQNPASSTAAARSLLRLLARPRSTWTTIELSLEAAEAAAQAA